MELLRKVAERLYGRESAHGDPEILVAGGGALEIWSPKFEENETGKWVISRVSIVRGVWRTPNGDGWPDDVDVQEHSSHDTERECAAEMARLLAEQVVGEEEERMQEDKMAEEMTHEST